MGIYFFFFGVGACFSRVSAKKIFWCFFGVFWCFCCFLGVFLCFFVLFFVFRALARIFFGLSPPAGP